MRRGSRLVGWLWRWHRRLGVIAAVFALLLAVTGIVLNHSAELGLDQRFVGATWLTRAYGDHSADLPAFQLGEQWVSRAANGRIYVNAREVARCSGPLIGAVQADGLLLAGCAEELLLIAPGGELVEAVSASSGLPTPLTGIGLWADRVALQGGSSWWLADLGTMAFRDPAPGGAIVSQIAPGALPASIRAEIPAAERWLSWERVILDVHSGRIVGRLGVLWMDLVGVLIATLATSGVAMWWLHRRRTRHN